MINHPKILISWPPYAPQFRLLKVPVFFFPNVSQDFCSFDPQVTSLMMEFHQVWHSIGGLKCHRYWSSTRKGVISGMPPEQNPSVSLRHWRPKNPCPTVQQVGHHQTITYQYMNKTINITFLSWTRGWVCKFKPSSTIPATNLGECPSHSQPLSSGAFFPCSQNQFFRSGQVFGVQHGHFWRSCPSISHKASSKSQEGMQMLKFRRLGPWQRRSVLHHKSHVGSVTVATGVEHLETTTAHLESCNRVGISNKNTLTNLKSLLWGCKDMLGCLFLSVACNN